MGLPGPMMSDGVREGRGQQDRGGQGGQGSSGETLALKALREAARYNPNPARLRL